MAKADTPAAGRIPVTVLTGFLGAGKTTLLRRLLGREGYGDTAVVVNELGDIPLDHLLVRPALGEALVLPSGCVCCATRGDLVRALGELYVGASRGELPPFSRVVLETTGLAEPTPILATLLRDPRVARGYRLGSVVTAVDAQLGVTTLDRHDEARKQAIFADRLLLTKPDLAEGQDLARLRARLAMLRGARRAGLAGP